MFQEMDRWLAKLIGLVLTFLLPFIFTVLPHHVEREISRGKCIICLLMCFAGGIFFATYLLHMGPEVRQTDIDRYRHTLYELVIAPSPVDEQSIVMSVHVSVCLCACP